MDMEGLLVPVFIKKHITAALDHYTQMVAKLRRGEWEAATNRAGKFVEAVLKSLYVYSGNIPAVGRQFKADQIIKALENSPAGSVPDTIKLTIPRACRFIYDVASNRGARHDPDEVNPNKMDANTVVMNCSWILGEMLRFAQKGTLNIDQTQAIVESLAQRQYPSIEEVDGRIYFHYAHLSATDVAALILAHVYPKRIARTELIKNIVRHDFSEPNARTALGRIARLYDDDGSENLKALAPCLQKADSIIQSHNA